MDQNQHGQPAQEAHGKNQYQSNAMMAHTNPPTQSVGPSVPSSYPREQQYAPQYIHQQQQHLQQHLNNFWEKQCKEIEEETIDFKTHNLPLARIKKIMKADRDVRMISAETPMLFSKACEMFVMELTMRAWANAEEDKRRTLKKSDIASAIIRNDMFDFLDDVFPRDDTMNRQVVVGGIPRTGTVPTPTENVPYDHLPPLQQHVLGPPYGAPRIVMGRPVLDQNHHGLQTRPSPTPMWPNPEQQNNHSPKLDD